MNSSNKARLWLSGAALVALIALASGVRLYRIGERSLWLDEAYSYARAALPAAETIAASIAKGHVPTYFLFMHYFIALGDDETMMRLPSAIFGVLTVVAAVVLGRVAGGLRVGLVAGLLVALSPIQVRYSQEARMYTMLTFTATVAMSAVLWLLAHPAQAGLPLWRKRAWRAATATSPTGLCAWLVYIASATSTLYLHNTGVFLIAACSCCALVLVAVGKGQRLTVLANWVLANLVVLALWSFWIKHLLVQTNKVMHRFWPDFPTPIAIWYNLKELYLYVIFGYTWFNVLLVVLALLGLFALRKRPLVAVGLVMFAVLPPVLVLLVSLKTPMFLPRIILWGPIPFFALVGAGFYALPFAPLPYLLTCAVLFVGQRTLEGYYYGYTNKPPWKKVAQLLHSNYDQKTRMLAARAQDLTVLSYYYGRRTAPVPRVPVEVVAPFRLRRYLRGVQKVWVVDQKRGKRSIQHKAELSKFGTLLRQDSYGSIVVFEFELGPPSNRVP